MLTDAARPRTLLAVLFKLPAAPPRTSATALRHSPHLPLSTLRLLLPRNRRRLLHPPRRRPLRLRHIRPLLHLLLPLPVEAEALVVALARHILETVPSTALVLDHVVSRTRTQTTLLLSPTSSTTPSRKSSLLSSRHSVLINFFACSDGGNPNNNPVCNRKATATCKCQSSITHSHDTNMISVIV